MLSYIHKNGQDVFALNTGFGMRALAKTEFTDIRKENFYILRGEELESFTFPEIDEIDGNTVIYSKKIKLDFKPIDYSNQQDILGVLNFILALEKRGIEIPFFYSNLFYKTNEDEIFMLPYKLLAFLGTRAKESDYVSIFQKYNFPGAKNPLVYSFGIILYEFILKQYPYNYETIEELRDKMRRCAFYNPLWINDKLQEGISETITPILSNESEISLLSLRDKLLALIENGYTQEESRGDFTSDKKKFEIKEKYRALIIKHRGRLVGIGIAAVVLTGLFGSMISSALKPPSTTGFTPREVIEAYFSSIQTLDTVILDDTLKKGVNKNLSTEISSLFVTSKMRQQYEGNFTIYTPIKWLDLPEEEKSMVTVYGINDLQITAISPLEFKVEYEKWASEPREDSELTGKQNVLKIKNVDIFTLEETKYSYIIVDIKNLESQRINVW